MEYFDPSISVLMCSVKPISDFVARMGEFQDTTLGDGFRGTILTDFNYCPKPEGCTTAGNNIKVSRDLGNHQTITEGLKIPTGNKHSLFL